MMDRKSARNMHSSNTNKIGIQCICWFYSQGMILYNVADLRNSSALRMKAAALSEELLPINQNTWGSTSGILTVYSSSCGLHTSHAL